MSLASNWVETGEEKASTVCSVVIEVDSTLVSMALTTKTCESMVVVVLVVIVILVVDERSARMTFYDIPRICYCFFGERRVLRAKIFERRFLE